MQGSLGLPTVCLYTREKPSLVNCPKKRVRGYISGNDLAGVGQGRFFGAPMIELFPTEPFPSKTYRIIIIHCSEVFSAALLVAKFHRLNK